MNVRIITASLLIFGSGVALGHFAFRPVSPSPSAHENVIAPKSETSLQSDSANGPVSTGSPAKTSTTAAVTESRSFEDFATEFQNWSRSADRANPRSIFDLFAKWGAADHDAALNAARNLKGTERVSALAAAMHGWAQQDPAAAWAYFKNNPSSFPDAGNVAGEIAGEYAKKMGVTVLSSIAELPENQQGPAYKTALETLAANGQGAQAAAAIAGISNVRLRDRALHGLATAMGRLDPQQAADWYSQLDPQSQNSNVVQALVSGMAYTDPQAAANWALTLDGKAGDSALREAVTLWARSGGALDASQWLNSSVPADKRNSALQGLVPALAQTDPDLAMQLTSVITDSRAKQQAVSSALYQWARQDPAAATNWVTQNASDPNYNSNMVTLVRVQAQQDPQAALTLANSITQQRQRDSAMMGIAFNWARQDPAAAESYFTSATGISDRTRSRILRILQRFHR